MHFTQVLILTISVIFSLFSGAASLNNLVARTDPSSDICGEVKARLKVIDPSSGKYEDFGLITACLCLPDVIPFIATDPTALAAATKFGRDVVATYVTNMIKQGEGSEQCHYPLHSVPVCTTGNPCGFTCKDGYTAYPPEKPTECICGEPHQECNGKCGNYSSCSSAYAKREAHYGGNKRACPPGFTACGILGRNARTWECINTQHELESCGGCSIPLTIPSPEGQDCTNILGVSDVSCVNGRCAVHRCMPGYVIDVTGSTCIYSEEKDPIILAAEYGLEHVPL